MKNAHESTHWKNAAHFLRTIDGLLDGAREMLTPEEHLIVLEAVRDECSRRMQAAGPQTIPCQEALANMMAALAGKGHCVTDSAQAVVLWNGLRPVISNSKPGASV